MRKIDKNTQPPKGTRSGKQLFFPYPSVFAKSYVRCEKQRQILLYLEIWPTEFEAKTWIYVDTSTRIIIRPSVVKFRT